MTNIPDWATNLLILALSGAVAAVWTHLKADLRALKERIDTVEAQKATHRDLMRIEEQMKEHRQENRDALNAIRISVDDLKDYLMRPRRGTKA